MGMMNSPSAYDQSVVQQTRQQGYAKLDDERRAAEERAKIDAQGRGVFFGTPLTNSLGDINERYLRGGADLEANLVRDQASRYQQDRMSAIQAILQYGQQQMQGQQMGDDLWLRLLQLQQAGMPQIPNPSGSIPMPG